ncbi:MAG: fumarate hydratase [Armatimonadetes bacterium]|nr:fumarate hydratase [Armatimonadota bacterium]
MRAIYFDQVEALVAELCTQANFQLPGDVASALRSALDREDHEAARWALEQIIRNAEIAAQERLPICQDTGIVACFIHLGRELSIDFDLYEAINAGVARAYTQLPLRKSMVADPLRRDTNTGDNTPAVVHVDVVGGDTFEVSVMLKGGGSENAGAAWMLEPSEGEDGIVEAVVEHVRALGGKWCPPGIIGIGIGGTLEHAALLSKKALLRPVGGAHPDERWAELERRLLEEINSCGPGVMGLGGRTTALAVHIYAYPCHIACLPVAVSFLCHAARRAVGKL